MAMDNAPATAKQADNKLSSNSGTINLITVASIGVLLAVAASSTRYGVIAAILLLAVPTVWLWQHERQRIATDRADQRTLIRVYACTATIGMLLVMALQGIMAIGTAYLLFGSEAETYMIEATRNEHSPEIESRRDERFRLSRTWQHWVYMITFAIVMAGMVEESLKYSALMLARRYGKVVHPHDNVRIAVAAALGFATMENLAFIHAAWSANETGPVFALTTAERLFVGIPGHSMMAALTGANVLAMDEQKTSVSWWKAIRASVAFHAGFDFCLFAISAYNGHVGWVHPREGSTLYLGVAVVVAFNLVLAVTLKRKLQHHGVVLW